MNKELTGPLNGRLRDSILNYFLIASNEKPSRTMTAATVPAEDSDFIELQWEEHDKLSRKFQEEYPGISWEEMYRRSLNSPEFSYLDLKIKIADKIMENCFFCEQKCQINRWSETGICRVKSPHIASEFLHMGEETPLIPSHTIFMAGCNFKCDYCQNRDISQQPNHGIVLEPEKLSKIIDMRHRQGSRNVNFVGGEPTPNLPYILRAMKNTKENLPVVWNSNLYLSEDGMKLIGDFTDLYLTDFKYGNDECALSLSGVYNYTEIVKRNNKMAFELGDMIIRHLVLPNHVECCSIPILKWISKNLGMM